MERTHVRCYEIHGRGERPFHQINRPRYFPFHSARRGVKLKASYDETGFATFCAATPANATLFQGFNAVQTFQSAHVFP